jgi:hypothetical protein
MEQAPKKDQAIIDGTRNEIHCPQCNAGKGEFCRGAVGERRHTPHIKRIRAYLVAHPEIKIDPNNPDVTGRRPHGSNRSTTRATIKRIHADRVRKND